MMNGICIWWGMKFNSKMLGLKLGKFKSVVKFYLLKYFMYICKIVLNIYFFCVFIERGKFFFF